jgi:hypothetical protein
MAATNGGLGQHEARSREEAVMSGLLLMPGVEHRLLYVELADHDDPWFVIPIARAVDQGFPVALIKPGADFERPTLPIAWIIIIDDRAAGASGPSSFDADTLRWLFADAYRIAVDAAEPQMAVYEHFVKEGMKGMRILVIRTVEDRLGVWREFSRENCELSDILELAPVTNNQERRISPSVTRFPGRSVSPR